MGIYDVGMYGRILEDDTCERVCMYKALSNAHEVRARGSADGGGLQNWEQMPGLV